MPTDPRATMSIQLGAAPIRAQTRRPGAPFRMLIVADLSGDAPRPPLSERQPLRIVYRGADDIATTRVVRIQSVVMERSLTLLNCDDLDKGEKRQFRLDRIERAEVV